MAGGTWGVSSDVSHNFALDQFKPSDVSGWIQYETQPEVQVRATLGSLKTTAANSGESVSDGSNVVEVPRLTSHVDYLTLSVSYEFVTGDYATGIFGGIGGYHVHPDETPPGFEFAQDPDRTVFGWHLGVDGTFKIVTRLNGIVRFTLHGFEAVEHHTILSAQAGLGWRF
jgi:hypothetical protein